MWHQLGWDPWQISGLCFHITALLTTLEVTSESGPWFTRDWRDEHLCVTSPIPHSMRDIHCRWGRQHYEWPLYHQWDENHSKLIPPCKGFLHTCRIRLTLTTDCSVSSKTRASRFWGDLPEAGPSELAARQVGWLQLQNKIQSSYLMKF